ncbi:hypothetical protein HII31_11291 [Pseudocercospora fuligena]|uniref:(S)-ureidoglycine aminohydrolase cupin domain-containing protein n=1 Tax=Pseudocercospora fuligena TaxID=685502 RepID=A0A8H6RBJ6_9PEZI|nr:hypothetical protein HII31_11291 [Pseudocercospora fuligena]
MGSKEPVAMTYLPKQQQDYKPPLIANDNSFLGDVYSSDKNDPDKPISAGFYRQEKGTKLVYTYHYHEMKIILDGTFIISDETGKEVTATKGDVFYFPAGSTITFSSPDFGLAFYCGQRKKDAA